MDVLPAQDKPVEIKECPQYSQTVQKVIRTNIDRVHMNAVDKPINHTERTYSTIKQQNQFDALFEQNYHYGSIQSLIYRPIERKRTHPSQNRNYRITRKHST